MKKKLRSEFNSRQYMLSEGFEVFYYSDLQFQSVGRHSHPYTEIYFFVEGAVDMELEGRVLPLRSGDVIALPPGTEHRAVIRDGAVPYRRFVLWLSDAYVLRLRQESADYLYLPDRAKETRDYVCHLNLLDFNGLRSRLFSLLEEQQTQRFGREAQIELYLRDLLLQLSRAAYGQRQPQARKELQSSYQAITAYISGHLEEDLSLDALSRRFFLNKYYIAHLIQENAGLSLHQYVTKKRLSACCDAMLGGESITACSARYGFLNYSSFYRAFRKEYGLSPAEYLRERSYQP